jgi:hypothetical protein
MIDKVHRVNEVVGGIWGDDINLNNKLDEFLKSDPQTDPSYAAD